MLIWNITAETTDDEIEALVDMAGEFPVHFKYRGACYPTFKALLAHISAERPGSFDVSELVEFEPLEDGRPCPVCGGQADVSAFVASRLLARREEVRAAARRAGGAP